MIITIDGLSANGKSTLAKKISEEINFKNFNTGAIYRCIAIEIINKKLDINNLDIVLKRLENIKIDFKDNIIFLNGNDVTKMLRTEKISMKSAEYGGIPEIKEIVKKIQREFIDNNDTVMEGRDIGTRIAPNADLKFYLYADFETRVKRLQNATGTNINEIRENLKLRDYIEINEGHFIKPDGAIEIDTTNKSLDEVYELMLKEIKKITGGNYEYRYKKS